VHELCDRIETNVHSLISRSEIYLHPEPQVLNHLEADLSEN